MRFAVAASVVLGAGLLMLSCGDDNNPFDSTTIKGSGTLTSEIRAVADFDGIALSATGRINISRGSPQSVTVTVDDNIMPYIETVVSAGRLGVRLQSGVKVSDYELTVDLVMDSLTEISIAGVGAVASSDQFGSEAMIINIGGVGTVVMSMDTDRLTTQVSGTGTLEYMGTATRHDCSMAGVGYLAAFGLETDTTVVNLGGQGNVQVHAESFLNVNISGEGSVYYHGHPSLNVLVSGTGSVIDAN